MAQKACKQCKTIFEDAQKCPNCGSDSISESFKGKLHILNPENSEIAKNLKITKKGSFAIKTG